VTLLCIIPGPTELLATEREPEHWCFKCRKRLPGDWRLMGDKFPSYYDPQWCYHCDGCDGDYMLFPGRSRWEE
jgi:hypothetical protein